MRKLVIVSAVLFATPSFAGLGGLLKALSKADDAARLGAKAASHADDVGRAAHTASHLDDAPRASRGAHDVEAAAHAERRAHGAEAAAHAEREGGNAAEIALEVGGAAIDAAPGAPPPDDGARAVELSKHTSRVAKLNRLEEIARNSDDGALLAQVERIRGAEQARHARRLLALDGAHR